MTLAPTDDDLSDRQYGRISSGAPRIHSLEFTKKERLSEQLTPGYIVECIKEHLTCATSHNPSEEEYIARVSACVTSLSTQKALSTIWNARRDGEERTVALPASCVFVFQGLLARPTLPYVERDNKSAISRPPFSPY